MVRTPQQHTTTLLIGIQASEELNTILDVLRAYPASINDIQPFCPDIPSQSSAGTALISIQTRRATVLCVLCNILLISRPMRQVFVDEK